MSIQHCLTMIGQLQWRVSLGRFDGRATKDLWYVTKTKHYSIRYKTEKPDISYLPNMKHDWSCTVYGNVQEIIPNNCPKPLCISVTTTSTLDANLSTALPLVHLSLHASISVTKHKLSGIPRGKQQWKQLYMVQSLW